MRQVSYKPINAEYLAAIKEVVRISDRKHNAWDKVKEFIAKAERLQPQQVKNDCKFPSPTGHPIASRETDTFIIVRGEDGQMRPLDGTAIDKTDADGLLPCPFCGGEAEIERKGTSRYSTIIACVDCGARLENGEEWGHGSAWNTRAQPQAVAGGDDETTECIHSIHPNQCVDCNGKCKSCGGDGIERCDNPDHGLLNALSFRGANESACPCCGHDEQYRMRHWDKTANKYVWNKCPDCNIPQPEAAKVALDDETADKYNASIALLKHHRIAADKLLTRHTVNDCIEALETALQTPASDGVLEDEITAFMQTVHNSILAKPTAIAIETYDFLDHIRNALKQSTARDVV